MKYLDADFCDERYRVLTPSERVAAIYSSQPLAAGLPDWNTMLYRLGLSDDLDQPRSTLAPFLEEHLLFYHSLGTDLPLRRKAFCREEEASRALVAHLRVVGWGALFAPVLPVEDSVAVHELMGGAEALLKELPPLRLEEELIARASNPAWARMRWLIHRVQGSIPFDHIEDGPIISRCRVPLLTLSFRALALAYLQERYRKVRCSREKAPYFQPDVNGQSWGVMRRFKTKLPTVWAARGRNRRSLDWPLDLDMLGRSFPGILDDLWHIQESSGSYPSSRSEEPQLARRLRY